MFRTVSAFLLVPATAVAVTVLAQTAPMVINLNDYDDGTTVKADVGNEIRVRLPEGADPTRAWAVRRDPHVFLIAPPTTVRQRGNTGIVGLRAYREFRVRVLSPGRFPLVFGLRSTTLGNDQTPARRIAYTVDAATEHGAVRTTAKLAVDEEGVRLVDPVSGASRAIPFGAAQQATVAALSGQGTPETGN